MCVSQYEDSATSPEHWRFFCCRAGEESPDALEQKISQGTSSQAHHPHPPLLFASLTCLMLLTTAGTSFFLPHLPSSLPATPQMRKDVSSTAAAQTGGSLVASTPADTPHLTETAVKEGEGGTPEVEVDGEAEEKVPTGASLAQKTSAAQDGVCGWVMF